MFNYSTDEIVFDNSTENSTDFLSEQWLDSDRDDAENVVESSITYQQWWQCRGKYFADDLAYDLTFSVIIPAVLFFCSMVGNTLATIVLSTDPDKKNPSTFLLKTLAVVDLMFVLCSAVRTAVWYITRWTIHGYTSSWRFALVHTRLYMQYAQLVFHTMSVWMILLVTIDRYIAVCHPLKNHLRTLARARKAVAGVVLGAFLYNIPILIVKKVERYDYNCLGIDIYYIGWNNDVLSTLDEHVMYRFVYQFVMYAIFCFLGPLVILIILNSFIIRRMQQRKKQRRAQRSTNSAHASDDNFTVMLIVVVCVFVLCITPYTVMRISGSCRDFGWDDFGVYIIFVIEYGNDIASLLLSLNSTINFLLYCLMWKKFRGLLCKLCGCCK